MLERWIGKLLLGDVGSGVVEGAVAVLGDITDETLQACKQAGGADST